MRTFSSFLCCLGGCLFVGILCLSACGNHNDKPNLPTCSTDTDCKTKEECVAGYCVSTGCKPGDKQFCYAGPDGTANTGACVMGHKTCENGEWTHCKGEVLPIKEVCGDQKDNNCDGKVDEGC